MDKCTAMLSPIIPKINSNAIFKWKWLDIRIISKWIQNEHDKYDLNITYIYKYIYIYTYIYIYIYIHINW